MLVNTKYVPKITQKRMIDCPRCEDEPGSPGKIAPGKIDCPRRRCVDGMEGRWNDEDELVPTDSECTRCVY